MALNFCCLAHVAVAATAQLWCSPAWKAGSIILPFLWNTSVDFGNPGPLATPLLY